MGFAGQMKRRKVSEVEGLLQGPGVQRREVGEAETLISAECRV